MCYSLYVRHVTRQASVQRQLLQCRTCGSHAFHVLDCCRNPDYIRFPTSLLGKRLNAWLEGVQAMVRMWLCRRQQLPTAPVSSATLDAWEARPLIFSDAEGRRARQETGADMAVEEVGDEMASAHR
jgi:hypothetical protein